MSAETSPVKQAILELRALRARVNELESERRAPIAVVGIGCRFPGASSPGEFWSLLRDGVDAIREIPTQRFDAAALYDPDPDAPGRVATRWAGLLDAVDGFDAEFFGITSREADAMDPQQRLVLEVAWESLEHAGISPTTLAGSRAGVYLGIGTSDYAEQRLMRAGAAAIDAHFATGVSHSVASGRLSYLLGATGPSLSVDTGCSSSLVAAHLAVQALRRGECDLALAGGVNLVLIPEIVMALSRAHMMAADGRCKAFDASADGFVRGEGCGMLVLKRLDDALADGDGILASIRGTAVNQDGRSNGLTAPSGAAQEDVIRTALADGDVEPASVDYVETHGTGTALGDPIEAQALGAVYGSQRRDEPLVIGSVKANIGHLEAAAGVAGLVKGVLALGQAEVPPQLHVSEPSPYVAWDRLRLEVPTTPKPWTTSGRRRAGVSSFSFSGTNAHVILEQAPDPAEVRSPSEREAHAACVSARTPEALGEALAALHRHLTDEPELDLGDVCATLNAGRAHHRHRVGIVVPDGAGVAGLRDALAALVEGDDVPGTARGLVEPGRELATAFLFTGQGSHYRHMGGELARTSPVFRDALVQCADILRPHLERPLLDLLHGGGDAAELSRPSLAQPALASLQVALVETWRSWGVEPALVLGHSAGEIAAAWACGMLELEDALSLAAVRGRLIEETAAVGRMAAVLASADRVAAVIEESGADVHVAVVNGPESVVVAGLEEAMQEAGAALGAAGIRTRALDIAYASHSPLVEPALAPLARDTVSLAHAAPRVPLVSATTGELVSDALEPAHWPRQLREPVRFDRGLETLAAQGVSALLEIGPSSTLVRLAERAWPGPAALPRPSFLSSLREGHGEWEQMLQSAVELHVAGTPISWTDVDRGLARRRLRLPTYPWQRRSHWHAWPDAPQASARPDVWAALTEAGAHASDRAPLDLDPGGYAELSARLDELALAGMRRALTELGDGAVDPRFEPVVRRWLAALEARGPLPSPDLDALEQNGPLAAYVARSARSLAQVVRGEVSPLELLFPAGSAETAEYLYESGPLARYLNGIARALVEAFVRARDDTVRVLEVGAGTGGTTAALVPVLSARRTSYLYTDVSELFLARGERRFADTSFLRYALFDVDRDAGEQGLEEHGYDLVVAANALHAARDLRAAIERARSLLSPGGMLLLVETTAHPVWFDATIGLIEGWNRYEDDLRQENPLLDATAWEEALRAGGFVATTAWPAPGSPAAGLGVSVLLAQAPLDAPRVTATLPPSTRAEPERPDATVLLDALAEATPGERLDLLADEVRRQVSRVTRSPRERWADGRSKLVDGGVDSLMALELASALTAVLALDEPLPSTLVFDHPSIDAVAKYLAARLAPEQPPRETSRQEVAVAELSDDDVEALILRKLEAR